MVASGPPRTPFGELGTAGRADGQFQSPQGVAVDSTGAVYVADSGNYRIQKFSAEGKFLVKWGRLRSNDEDWRFWLESIAVTRSDEVVVLVDQAVRRFDAGGRSLGQWPAPRRYVTGINIAVDGDGNVYAVDANARVVKLDRHGKPLAGWGGPGGGAAPLRYPTAVAVDSTGALYIADDGKVKKYDPRGALLHEWGSVGDGEGHFRWPSSIAVNAQGRVYVTGRWSNRIQVFAALEGGQRAR